jgi:DNA-binding YbaB/EbfC family protein
MNDMFNMMGKLTEAKEKMEEVRNKLPFINLQEVSDDGLVTIDFTADKQVQQVHIDNQLLTPEKQENLQYQIAETMNAAMEKASATYKAELKNNLEGTLPNIPGMDLENLPF